MFGGFQKESGAVNVLLHFIHKTSKVTGVSEELDFRIKLSLNHSDCFAPYLSRLSSRSIFFGLRGDVSWAVVSYRGEEAYEVDLNEPISSLKLSNTAREVQT